MGYTQLLSYIQKTHTVYTGIVRNDDLRHPDAVNITRARMLMRIRTLKREALIGRVYSFQAVNANGQVVHAIKMIDKFGMSGSDRLGFSKFLSTLTLLYAIYFILEF